jgi:XRE family transcriptional regulator, regulator of sulfur utilization
MELRELFGGKVRALRQAKRLTQEQLGERANLHNTYIGAIERAETNLSMDNIGKLARGLDIEPGELFRFSSQNVPVGEQEKMLLEVLELLRDCEQKDLEHILRIVEEALELRR